MARDAVRGRFDGASTAMAVEVRTDAGPVLQLKFSFEMKTKDGVNLGTFGRCSR
jgi:hypothetical protein